MGSIASTIRVACLLVASITGAVSAEDPCAGYATGFESFSGPPDQDGTPLGVRWCMDDASIAGSGFCPTGRALRLDQPGDTVGLRLETIPGCTGIRLRFTGSSIFETLTRLELRDTTMDGCGGIPLDSILLSTSGGICTPFEVWLPPLPGGITVLRWVHGDGAGVFLIDDLVVELEGCCGATHDCCETGGAGCVDPAIAECVCLVDPYCCETAWDALCVGLVEESGCGHCGGSCGAGFATDFGDQYVPGGPCAVFPELFDACEGEGPWLSVSGGCASPQDVSVRFGDGYPWSTFWTRCLDLSGASVADLAPLSPQ